MTEKPNDILNRSLSKSLKNQLGSKASALIIIRDKARMMGLDPDECTIEEVFTLSMITSAMNGKGKVTQEIMDRVEGKAPDVVRNGANGNNRESLSDLTEEQLERILKK